MYDIIVFSTFYKPHIGGVEKYVENFCKRLPNRKTLIITSKYEKKLKTRDQDLNLDILRIDSLEIIKGKYFIPTIKGLKQIREILKKSTSKKTEVHTHTRFYFNNFIATLLSKKYKLKHYHFEHGSSFVKDGSFLIRLFSIIFDKTFGKYILKNANLVFPISKGVKNFLEKSFKDLSYGPILYNSYNFKDIVFKKKSKPSKLKILFVGRLVKSKGVCELIEATNILAKKNFSFSMTIIGDGSEMQDLKNYISENDLDKHIDLKGKLEYEKTQSLYSKHDLFVNPSYSEGLPTTVLEALANSLLIIATDVGGTREIIPKEHLIKREAITPGEIVKFIEHIYNDWGRYQDIFYSIYSNTYQIFNWDNVVKIYKKVSID